MKEVFEMATEKLYGASRGPRTKRYSYVVSWHVGSSRFCIC